LKRVFFRIIVAFLAFALVFSFVYSVLAAPSFSLDGSKVAHVLLIDAETGKVLVESAWSSTRRSPCPPRPARAAPSWAWSRETW